MYCNSRMVPLHLHSISFPLWPVLTLPVGTWCAVCTKLEAIFNNFSSFDQRDTQRWLVQYRAPQETADSICLVKQLKDKNQSPSHFYFLLPPGYASITEYEFHSM